MPKILIKEIDETSPGTPGRYSNYSVLVPGWIAKSFSEEDYEKNPNLVRPDVNGIYEFTSKDKFVESIGETEIEHEVASSDGKIITIKHYGNIMAHELLDLGYPVIYAPIEDRDSTVDLLSSASFWSIFRDKANYDFRFVTHGLLESAKSTVIAEGDQANYTKAVERLKDIEAAIEAIDTITGLNVNSDVQESLYDELCSSVDSNDSNMQAINRGFMYKVTKTLAPSEKFTDDNGEVFENTTDADIEVEISVRYTNLKDTEDENGQVIIGARTGTAEERISLVSEINDYLANASKDSVLDQKAFNDVNLQIAKLAEYVETENSKEIPGRGDCTALIELDKRLYINTGSPDRPENLIIEAINNLAGITETNGKYCAMTVPSVFYKKSGQVVEFPGAFHYLACFKNSLDMGFAEWYAAAGYTRGVSSYTVDHTSVKLGEIAINALEPRYLEDPLEDYPKFACNVIAYFRGSYYLWGNRTAHPLGKKGNLKNGDLTASSFLNIRQLCTTIKKQLYVACRRFTFDPNSDTLWFNFVNAIKPTLEAMKSDQGIRDYKIVKEYTDKKATLKAKIRIIPIEAVEDFDLTVTLEDAFGETAVTAGETV